MLRSQIIVLLVNCFVIMKYAATNASHLEVSACHENSSSFTMGTNKPKLVDAIPGSLMHLWCHFCDGKEDYFPKLWFFKPRGYTRHTEVSDIENNDFSTKLAITPVHVLNIFDFNENNSGIYTCKSPESLQKGNVFTYILEGVIYDEMVPKVGTSIQWKEYKRNYLDIVNKKLRMSKEEPFESLRRNLNKTFKLTTIWENWGECKDIDRQKGLRKRIGRCRLHPSVDNTTLEVSVSINGCGNVLTRYRDWLWNAKTMPMDVVYSTDLLFLTDGYDISCRSLQLNKTIPKISEILRNIPDFEEEEPCHVIKRVKHKINKDQNKRKTTKRVEENSHVTLSCTEAVTNSDLKWFKEAKLLNSLFRNYNKKYNNEEEPHISIDANNSLHILHISKNEEGNYSCLSNGKKIQVFEVTVVTKSKLLNKEFLRYSIYLGFVLSLAMSCYCVGVYIAWHRRSSFVDPLSINRKGGTHEYHRLQCERE